jgi:hypothetical protein
MPLTDPPAFDDLLARLAGDAATDDVAVVSLAAHRVGLEYTIVAVTCFFSQQPGAVTRRSGTRV